MQRSQLVLVHKRRCLLKSKKIHICVRSVRARAVCVCLCDPCDTSAGRAASFSAACTAVHQGKRCCALEKRLRDNPRLVCLCAEEKMRVCMQAVCGLKESLHACIFIRRVCQYAAIKHI